MDILVQASTDKDIREMELFGPDFGGFEEVQAELDRVGGVAEAALVTAAHSPPDDIPVNKSKAKTGKVVAKSTGLTLDRKSVV